MMALPKPFHSYQAEIQLVYLRSANLHINLAVYGFTLLFKFFTIHFLRIPAFSLINLFLSFCCVRNFLDVIQKSDFLIIFYF